MVVCSVISVVMLESRVASCVQCVENVACIALRFVMCGFCNVWVCVCVGCVMCGCVYVWVV